MRPKFMFEVLKKDINIFDSLNCGQIFRFKSIDEKTYVVFSLDKRAKITDLGDRYELNTTDDKYFKDFLNLDVDYIAILDELRKNKSLTDLIPQDNVPLRILKQDLFEMIISFIISANNNIPRIKKIIEKLCETCGENKGDYFAFPKAEVLAKKDEEFYKAMGLGYRAPYILKTAQKISNNVFDMNLLVSLDTESARKMLLTLPGVGPKVADCILLFGLNRYDVFPVDTWIEKVYKDIFKKDNTPQNMRKDLIKEFGRYSGIAQQYLFYAKRG